MLMEYNLKESGRRIQQLRKSKGFTQETFAEKLGYSDAFIASVETGRKGISIDALLLMAEVLDCTLDYLITGKTGDNKVSKLLAQVAENKKEVAEKILLAILENL